MDTSGATRGHGGGPGGRGRGVTRNKQWFPEGSRPHSPGHSSDGERSQRGGRGRGRGRGQFARGGSSIRTFPNKSLRNPPQSAPALPGTHTTTANGMNTMVPAEFDDDNDNEPLPIIEEPELDAERRERLYQELVSGREQERKKAIAEGKMDDPNIPKRLEDAINIVGTCPDMCPRFERYRREREKNYDKWERIPNTMRLDHQRTVKVYERAAGDKVLPSDLRPPHVLRKTLDYLFHDLLLRGGLTDTFPFIRDRSRAVRNDFAIQQLTGPSAIEAHVRCVRFHILVMHFERENKMADMHLEEQQCNNALLSLRDFYEDQRGKYESPDELEMRIYHRLLQIRDQKERQDGIPDHILNHPAFKLVTEFRFAVQKASEPITKRSTLFVDAPAMEIFGKLVGVLQEMGNTIMIYLVACIMEKMFGADTIEDIETLRGGLSLPDIIDGRADFTTAQKAEVEEPDLEMVEDDQGDEEVDELDQFLQEPASEEPSIPASVSWPTTNPASQQPSVFGMQPKQTSVFGPVQTQSSPASVFSTSQSAPAVLPQKSAFSSITSRPNAFGNLTFGIPTSTTHPKSAFSSVFSTGPSPPEPTPTQTSQLSFSPNTSATAPPVVFPRPAQAASPGPVPFAPPSQTAPGPGPHPTLSKPPDFFSSKPSTNPSPPAAPAPLFSSTPPSNVGPFKSANGGLQLNPQAPPFAPLTSFTAPLVAPIAPSVKPMLQRDAPPPVAGPSGLTVPLVAPPLKLASSLSATSSRASPPPPLKIDTAWSISSSTSTPPAATLASTSTSNANSNATTMVPPSPREPPPLERVQPVSLPSTPTIWAPPQSALIDHHKGILGTPPATATPERSGILSPLAIQTPKTGLFPPTLGFSPAPTRSSFGLALAVNGTPVPSTSAVTSVASENKGKGKERARISDDWVADLPTKVGDTMEDQAIAFERKKAIAFKHRTYRVWVKRATDMGKWREACSDGDAYVARVREQRALGKGKQKANGAVNGSPRSQDLKRRNSNSLSLSMTQGGESPQRKKARKRVSSVYQPPRTDEELAARFKKNQADVERRWAQGSFLNILRTYFTSRLPPPPTSTLSASLSASQRQKPFVLPAVWQAWLSMNPNSEATAIWFERKFDVPDSGRWISDGIFAIPVGVPTESDETVSEHPGIIVFECTPLDGVDELEQKYRVLDDTSRLRQVVESFPQRRYYRPSVVFMCWARSTEAYTELFGWTSQRVADGTVGAYGTVLLNNEDKDPDTSLHRALKDLTLDGHGELVRSLTLRDLFKHFSGVLTPFIREWLDTCSSNPIFFNWKLYNLLLHTTIGLLNRLIVNFCQLTQCQEASSYPESVSLPEFEDNIADDSESTYEYVKEWLSGVLEETDVDVSLVSVDIESHQKIEQEFPCSAFLDHLLEIAQAQAEGALEDQSQAKMPGTSGPTTRYLVLNAELDLFTEALEDSLNPLRVKLSHRLSTTARREPRRRAHSSTTSEMASPTSKRMRLSTTGSVNGEYDNSRSSSPFANGYSNGHAHLGSESTSILDLSADASSMAVSATPTPVPRNTGAIMSIADLRASTASVRAKYLGK